MKSQVVFPGSFDPLTFGHIDIIKRLSSLFDHVIVAVGKNVHKSPLMSHEVRVEIIQKVVKRLKLNGSVEVCGYSGLVVDFLHDKKIGIIARGLRNQQDFTVEQSMAQLHRNIDSNIETILMPCKPEFGFVSSSLLKELVAFNGDIKKHVPQEVIAQINPKPLD
jgi:pantetheine-phosphate adenylyltransferase